MRTLVTGATGMIGANLVRRLLASDPPGEVVVTHRRTSDCWRLADVQARVTQRECDLLDPRSADKLIGEIQPDCVFHLASSIWHKDSRHFETNVLGTQQLLDAVRTHCPQARFVFAGSSATYGPGDELDEDQLPAPTTIYGASKAAVSTLLQTYHRLYDLNVVELRLFTPFGPWEDERRLIPYVITSILAGDRVQLTSGVQERDFVFITDVLDALELAAASTCRGEVVNIGSGRGVTVRQTAQLICRQMDVPPETLQFGAMEDRVDEMLRMSADISKASRVLGWQPRISLEDGVRRTIEWFAAVKQQ